MTEPSTPFCLCLAGPNGSGKSTATKGIRSVLAIPNWIDPDVVAAEAHYHLAGQQSAQQIDQIAFRAARNKRLEYAQNLQSFGFETVFSHISNIEFLDALKMIGYIVHLYFVCTDDPNINIGRVRNRHSLGGHDVPEDKIVDRYYRSLDYLAESVHRFDRIVLIDNSEAHAPGKVVGEITNEPQKPVLVRMFPRPHLPFWLAQCTSHGFRRSANPMPMALVNPQLKSDAGLRATLLNKFEL